MRRTVARPEPEAARAVARRIVELVELLEDALVLLGRDADAGSPRLRSARRCRAGGRRRATPPLLGVAQRVRRRDSTARGTAAWRPSPASPSSGAPTCAVPCPAPGTENVLRTRSNTAFDRHDLALHFDLSGVELRDVEQVVEQLLERFGALQDLVDQLRLARSTAEPLRSAVANNPSECSGWRRS